MILRQPKVVSMFGVIGLCYRLWVYVAIGGSNDVPTGAVSFIMWFGQCYGLNRTHHSPNSYVEMLTPNVSVYGEGALRWLMLYEVIREGSYSGRIGNLIRRGRERELFLSVPCPKEGPYEDIARRHLVCKPARELSPGIELTGILIFDIQLP